MNELAKYRDYLTKLEAFVDKVIEEGETSIGHDALSDECLTEAYQLREESLRLEYEVDVMAEDVDYEV